MKQEYKVKPNKDKKTFSVYRPDNSQVNEASMTESQAKAFLERLHSLGYCDVAKTK